MSFDPDDDAAAFRLFWEASKLNRRTVVAFAEKLEVDDRSVHDARELVHSESVPLASSADDLFSLMALRRSGRDFAATPIDEQQVGRLFGAFAHRAGGRLLPSAGGRYPIEVFAFLFHVEGPLGGHIVHYDGAAHAAARVGPCPAFESCRDALGLSGGASPPAIVFCFVGIPDRVLDRYGERGGRFLLIECGHHAHSLALRVAREGLAGYELGGTFDDDVARRLGLDPRKASTLLAYACGARP